jgi:ABC-type Zn uptake system ZnuABC Zn-binding protein ZnuA
MMTETYLIDKDDIIVEGYQVTPEIVEKIIKKFGKKNIQSIFLVKHDEKKFVKDLHKSTTPNDWIIRKTKEEATFHKIAKMISEYSKYFEKEAKKYKFTVFTMDQDFEKQIKKAIQLLIKK